MNKLKSQLIELLLKSGIYNEFILEFSKDNSFNGCFANHDYDQGWKINLVQTELTYQTLLVESDIDLNNWTLFSKPWRLTSDGYNGEFAQKLGKVISDLGMVSSTEFTQGKFGIIKFVNK